MGLPTAARRDPHAPGERRVAVRNGGSARPETPSASHKVRVYNRRETRQEAAPAIGEA